MFKQGKTHQQQSLFDPIHSFSPVVEKMLKNSWAGNFFENVFLEIREKRFATLFSEKYSRPNVPVNLLVSLLILKELNQLTDEALIEALVFDYRFHYALGIVDMEEERISINTLTNFRNRLLEHETRTGQDLLHEEIEYISLQLAKRIGLDHSWARMDSMMISSSCKAMSRLELVYVIIRNMVRQLRQLEDVEVPEAFQPFLSPTHEKDLLYRARTDETQTRLEVLFDQAITLYQWVSSIESCYETDAFKHLERLLNEQTVETEEGTQIPIPSKEIKASSLQNPSDPDATYRKKGKKSSVGYVANFVEVRDSDKEVGLILQHNLQPNVHSDADFGEDFVSQHPLMSSIDTLVADGAYYRSETVKKAQKQHVSFHVTQMTGKKEDPSKIQVSQFTLDEDTHKIIRCPAGHRPEHAMYDEKTQAHLAKFAKSQCGNCPFLPTCLVKKGKKGYRIRFTENQRISSEMRAQLSDSSYRERACFRAGVEGIPSVLRRALRIEYLPIRGLVRSKMWISLKIMAYNIKRVVQYQNRAVA